MVDQYMVPECQKDRNTHYCNNGMMIGIYDCRGEINRQLPLAMYPNANTIHKDIRTGARCHACHCVHN